MGSGLNLEGWASRQVHDAGKSLLNFSILPGQPPPRAGKRKCMHGCRAAANTRRWWVQTFQALFKQGGQLASALRFLLCHTQMPVGLEQRGGAGHSGFSEAMLGAREGSPGGSIPFLPDSAKPYGGRCDDYVIIISPSNV